MIIVMLPPKFECWSSKNEVSRIKLVRAAKIANFIKFSEIWRTGYFQEFLAFELQTTTSSQRKNLEGFK